MTLPQQLAVSTVPSAGASSLGAIVDCGPNQNGARTFSINSASLSTGDQVQILGSNDGFVADAFVLGYLNTSDSTTPGQNTALVSPYTARYLRTYRVLGTAAVTVEAAEDSPTASGGGGGSTGPLTSMTPFVQPNLATGGNIGTNAVTTVDTYTSFDVNQTTGAQTLTFITPTSTTVDKLEIVSNDGSAAFTMYGQVFAPGAFGLVKFNSQKNGGAGYEPLNVPQFGGTSFGVSLQIGTDDAHEFAITAHAFKFAKADGTTTTLGIASSDVAASALALQWGTGGAGFGVAAPGASGLALDTPVGAGLTVAALNATSWTVGSSGGAQAGKLTFGTGGLGVGQAAPPGASGIAITSGGILQGDSGPGSTLTWNSGTTGDVNLGTGIAGADVDAKTIRVGTGAAAKTLVMGSTNTTSTTTLACGSGGLGLGGAAAPGGSGIAIDTPAAGPITVGTANANALTMGNAAAPTRINTTGLGFNGVAGATALIDANNSTTQGVRFPNMTTAQKNAIANTAGLVVFDTTLGKLCVNTGAGWQTITSA